MTNVRANRTVAVVTEEGRKKAPLDTLSNKITEGKSNGWALIYARGPEGEALEFVQALSPVKEVFETAFANRKKDAQEGKFENLHASLRVCPKTSGGITKFSEHEAD